MNIVWKKERWVLYHQERKTKLPEVAFFDAHQAYIQHIKS